MQNKPSSSNDSLNRSMCMVYLTKGIVVLPFHPTTKAESGVLGRYEGGRTYITYIAESKTGP